jgi:hypothetical protein
VQSRPSILSLSVDIHTMSEEQLHHRNPEAIPFPLYAGLTLLVRGIWIRMLALEAGTRSIAHTHNGRVQGCVSVDILHSSAVSSNLVS